MSTSDFKLAKSNVLANFYVRTPIAFFKSAFVAQLDKSNPTLTLPPEDLGSGKYSLVYAMYFLTIQMLKELQSLSI